jgi:uncharacterized protein YecE (DUF72 family)
VASGRIRVGISGWRYAPWRGVFYPQDLPQRAELEFASRAVNVIEINGSFYSLQRPASYAQWYEQTPQDFIFSLKGPRYITHTRRLRDVEKPLANLFASGVFNLREKLGPLIWQLPPNMQYEPESLGAFLRLLPRDTEQAAALARRRDAFMKGRSRLATDAKRELRHAIEIRHVSFLQTAFIEALREHNVALVISESARHWPMVEDVTADFIYMRLHGDRNLYRGGYSNSALERWAARIRCWSSGSEPADARKVLAQRLSGRRSRDVYCFFDNTDIKLRAPTDAQSLMQKLGLRPAAAMR